MIASLPASVFSNVRPFIIDLNLIATNKCTQNCPMCNSALQYQANSTTITLEEFQRFVRMLRPYHVATCSISGGEPTLVPDMPKMLEFVVEHFPFGVSILSNLYGNSGRIRRVMESALRNNVTICVSFDGFGEIADKLRDARHVSERVTENIEAINEMRKELASSSILTLHTVISDMNLHQLPDILAFSKEMGWTHTIAPINHFYYLPSEKWIPKLSYSRELVQACNFLLKQPHLSQLHSFIREIPNYARNRASKLCPYLSRVLKTFKLFLEPNGDISLCDRVPIGSLLETPLSSMFNGPKYEERLQTFSECQGCWLSCFVEPFLAIKTENLVRLDFLNRIPK